MSETTSPANLIEQIEALLASDNTTPRVPGTARVLLRMSAAHLRHLSATPSAANARVKVLEEALKPFASEDDQRRQYMGHEPDDWPPFRNAYRITVGDLRRARAALQAPAGEGGA